VEFYLLNDKGIFLCGKTIKVILENILYMNNSPLTSNLTCDNKTNKKKNLLSFLHDKLRECLEKHEG
jgi:hypothetical protein